MTRGLGIASSEGLSHLFISYDKRDVLGSYSNVRENWNSNSEYVFILRVYDLGLSLPGIEPLSPACEANAPPLRHHSGRVY